MYEEHVETIIRVIRDYFDGVDEVKTMGQVAHLKMLGFNYYDFLSLGHVNGDWKIVNKVFAHVE